MTDTQVTTQDFRFSYSKETEAAVKIVNWLQSNKIEVSFETAATGSIYITCIENDDVYYRIRISDHSAEVSSYHWGRAATIHCDLVLTQSSKAGKEYANAWTVSEAVRKIAADLDLSVPARFAERKKAERKPTPKPIIEVILLNKPAGYECRLFVRRHTGTVQKSKIATYKTEKVRSRFVADFIAKYPGSEVVYL